MFESLRETIRRNLINIPGWRTDRKIVVFESDDWGMIRMASKNAYNWFLKNEYQVNQCPYNKYDIIERNEDLELLLEVLNSVKDKHGNPAIFTVNNIVANPDFKKIKQSNFDEYYFEPFTETLKHYPDRDNVLELYNQGIDNKTLLPQFHGREHLNINRWMRDLNAGNELLLDAFKHNMFTVHKSGNVNGRRDYLDAFGIAYKKEWVSIREIIETGLNLFEEIWGYSSTSFIAPCYVWPKEIESVLAENGIKFIQGTHVQRIPLSDDDLQIQKEYHYTGQRNESGQTYLVRNVNFEPTEDKGDPVDKALKEIKIAFRYKKPAIISSHRVNYIGGLWPENRNKNLKLLSKLLHEIINYFPEVEFMSTKQLGNLILEES